jgi:hypothetical protein
MLEHAFTRLGLHRVALSVFAFNERAIRAYRKAGFVIEGRAREAIWRDGRYWDELTMSVLESEWRVTRVARAEGDSIAAAAPARTADIAEVTAPWEPRTTTGRDPRAVGPLRSR